MRALEVAGATAFTAALYWVCSWVQRRLRIALLHPLLLSVIAGGTLFSLLPPRWLDGYVRGSGPMLWLLGPATAALALPFYRRRAFLAEHPWTTLLAAVVGSATTIAAVWGLGALLGLPARLLRAASLKSVTLPVALGLADVLHTEPGLTTVCVFTSGLIGSAIGPPLLTWLGVRSPVARGLVLGTLSHAIGTARALEEDALAGAAGVVALTLSALLIAGGVIGVSLLLG
ncbi:MAG TPA: LrgB family protein [Myxococcaceae bacterium]|nr:LrgB family protein [Myxococcaceae bacterium]